MYEKVNVAHPDKLADRIAGAIVDLAYKKQENPKIAVEVLIGHGNCHIIAETSVAFEYEEIKSIVNRIVPDYVYTDYKEVPQDVHLADNQVGAIRCGDNGVFKGVPITNEQRRLAEIVKDIYEQFPSDGKYIISEKDSKLIICQSKCVGDEPIFNRLRKEFATIVINPLGYWDGGINSDTGATNRKLGSDMGDSVTGGGTNGKDLSKADVSVNIYAWLKAQETGEPVELHCAIGDETIDGKPYSEIVKIAKDYIDSIGGFEKFSEYGLIRP